MTLYFTGRKFTKKQHQLPLRAILIIPFVIQTAGAVGLVGYLSYRNSEYAVTSLADQLQHKVSEQVNQHLDSYLATPQLVNQLNLDAIDQKLLNLNDLPSLGQYFWQQAQIFKSVSYISYTSVKGDFVGAGAWIEGKGIVQDEVSAATAWKANTYATDDRGNRTQRIQTYDYSPKSEEWYVEGVHRQKAYWTKALVEDIEETAPYVSTSLIYPVMDQNDRVVGILGADLLLSNVSKFLHQLKTSPSNQIYIIQSDGTLIASSLDKPPYEVVNGKAQLIHISDSEMPLLRAFGQVLQQEIGSLQSISARQTLQFQYGGDRQFVEITPWRDALGLEWLVVVIVPESDFMAQIQANNVTTILLCLGTLAISIVLGVLTSRWITKPILRLNVASQAIAAGELDQSLNQSGVKELNQVSDSFNFMAQQLRESFTALAQTNQALETVNTELKHSQLQLVQHEKMSTLGNLVAGIGHEINNPVSFIAGNIPMAKEYVSDLFRLIESYQQQFPDPGRKIESEIETIDLAYLQEDLPKLLGSMTEGVNRIQTISTSLRTFSRADSDAKQPFDLHAGLDSTLLLLKHRLKATAERPAIDVIKCYGTLPLVKCYPGQLNQVFMNLLANAIEALEESNLERTFDEICARPNQLFVVTEFTLDQAIVRICDNGIGIAEEDKARIFESLFTTKAVGAGTGLGLAIARQIVVEKHGGQLSCESTLGKGAAFTVVIPLQ